MHEEIHEGVGDVIEAMQRRLALQRETLQRQFAAADLIMETDAAVGRVLAAVAAAGVDVALVSAVG